MKHKTIPGLESIQREYSKHQAAYRDGLDSQSPSLIYLVIQRTMKHHVSVHYKFTLAKNMTYLHNIHNCSPMIKSARVELQQMTSSDYWAQLVGGSSVRLVSLPSTTSWGSTSRLCLLRDYSSALLYPSVSMRPPSNAKLTSIEKWNTKTIYCNERRT